MRRRAAVCVALCCLASVLGSSPSARPAADPRTVTFIVASDSHFGARGMDEVNREVVRQMNALPGTPYPPEVCGIVDRPRGVLFTGDMTDNGHLDEFALFEEVYG